MMLSTRILSVLVFGSLIASVHGHDPGLSSADVLLQQDRVVVTVGFNARDARVAASSNLEAIRESCFEVLLDGASIPAQTAVLRVNVNDNVEYRLCYPLSKGSNLLLRSPLLAELPLGHRQYLKVVTPDGKLLAERLLSTEVNSYELSLANTAASAPAQHPTFLTFFWLGVRHILTGYDHLLFLGGLLLVCVSFRQAAVIITCFTIAHSLTLALATFQIVSISSRVVEPAIAASITYIGIENIIRGERVKWRWLLTLAFGLIHGLGFASALREVGIGVDGNGVALPLLSFNLGVETGQLCVAALVLPIILVLRNHPGFLKLGVPIGSTAISFAGAFWFIERIVTG